MCMYIYIYMYVYAYNIYIQIYIYIHVYSIISHLVQQHCEQKTDEYTGKTTYTKDLYERPI